MFRLRGFSLLEIMLALIVVSIGISVLLAFSASNQREANNASTGNDYSLVVNDILAPFIKAVSDCSAGTSCDLINKMNSDYTAESYYTLVGTPVSDAQKAALNAAGIDLTQVKISLSQKRSDSV